MQRHALVSSDVSIENVIQEMNTVSYSGGEIGIAVVVDSDSKVVGVVTDGDIRNAICNKVGLFRPITELMSKNFVHTHDNLSRSNQLKAVLNQIQHLTRLNDPRLTKVLVINDQREFVDIINLYELYRYGDVTQRRTAIYGLGYVGLTLALTLAELGDLDVTGVDINAELIEQLRLGQPQFYENGLRSLLDYCVSKELIAFESLSESSYSDVHIIAVGTPVDANQNVLFEYLDCAGQHIGRHLRQGNLVICRSTVPVGTTRNRLIPLLEKHSGLVAGKDFHVSFAPERTVEGSALKELKTIPQIIGGLTPECSLLTGKLFRRINSTIVSVEKLESAELVKLINNTFRDTVFAFANDVALSCDRFNVNAFDVVKAANEGYPRNPIPLPSPGVGGICLVKDPLLYNYGKEVQHREMSPFGPATRRVNSFMSEYIGRKYEVFLERAGLHAANCTVFIIGLAFKGLPETSDTRYSPAIDLVRRISASGKVLAYDVVVSSEEIESLGLQAVTLSDGMMMADAVFVMNNHPGNSKIDIFKVLSGTIKPKFFFDGWALFNRHEIESIDGLCYSTLGYMTPKY